MNVALDKYSFLFTFLHQRYKTRVYNTHNSGRHVQRQWRRALRRADSEYKSGFKKQA